MANCSEDQAQHEGLAVMDEPEFMDEAEFLDYLRRMRDEIEKRNEWLRAFRERCRAEDDINRRKRRLVYVRAVVRLLVALVTLLVYGLLLQKTTGYKILPF
jgi:hypothetical protein